MPSKRDLLSSKNPFDGLHVTDLRWKRIIFFFGGVSTILLYFRIDLFQHLPEWAAATLASGPVGLVLYGSTERTWQTSMRQSVGVEIGLGLMTYLDATGIHLFRNRFEINHSTLASAVCSVLEYGLE